jgi:hypothetical protein
MTPEAPSQAWETVGVPAGEVGQWNAIGFGPFQAALARGDGFTPLIAGHWVYQHQFTRTEAVWRRSAIPPAESLRWHRAGFAPKQAATYRAAGVDLNTARASRRVW